MTPDDEACEGNGSAFLYTHISILSHCCVLAESGMLMYLSIFTYLYDCKPVSRFMCVRDTLPCQAACVVFGQCLLTLGRCWHWNVALVRLFTLFLRYAIIRNFGYEHKNLIREFHTRFLKILDCGRICGFIGACFTWNRVSVTCWRSTFFFFLQEIAELNRIHIVLPCIGIYKTHLALCLLSNFLFCFVFQILFYAGKHPTVIRIQSSRLFEYS